MSHILFHAHILNSRFLLIILVVDPPLSIIERALGLRSARVTFARSFSFRPQGLEGLEGRPFSVLSPDHQGACGDFVHSCWAVVL